MGFLQIVAGLAQFLLVTAGAFVLLCVVASYLRFQSLTQKAGDLGEEEMDPHDAFQVLVAHRLGTMHREPEPFSLLVAAPDNFAWLKEQYGESAVGEILRDVEGRVRGHLRSNDSVLRVDGDRIGVLLAAPRQRIEKITARIIRSLASEPCRCPSGPVVPVTLNVGAASHPENGDRVGTLLEAARHALKDAESKGSGTCVLAPTGAPEAAVRDEDPAGAARYVDPLTGLLKPERVGSAVQKFVAGLRRQGQPVSLLLMDVDHLQRYNEHYGREAGDAILRGLGKLLQESVREEDLLARLGGAELLAVLGCAPAQAVIAGQRLVAQVKRTPFLSGASQLRVTVSIGVAGYPDHGGNPRYLLEAADIALHAAKDNGRNMCLLYDSSMSVPKSMSAPTDVF